MTFRKEYYVYILMNSRRTVLYIGVTSDISRRWFEHYKKVNPNSFSARYHCNELVYLEPYDDIYVAKQREKQLKGWKRSKKISLITKQNPTLSNLFSS